MRESEIISEFEMFEIRSSAFRSCEGSTGHSHRVQSERTRDVTTPPLLFAFLAGRSPWRGAAGGHETVRSARGVLQEARLREGELGAKRDSYAYDRFMCDVTQRDASGMETRYAACRDGVCGHVIDGSGNSLKKRQRTLYVTSRRYSQQLISPLPPAPPRKKQRDASAGRRASASPLIRQSHLKLCPSRFGACAERQGSSAF